MWTARRGRRQDLRFRWHRFVLPGREKGITLLAGRTDGGNVAPGRSPRSQKASHGACLSLDAFFHRRRTGKKSGVASVSADAHARWASAARNECFGRRVPGRFLAAWPTRKVGFQELGWFAGSVSGCTAETLTLVAVTP